MSTQMICKEMLLDNEAKNVTPEAKPRKKRGRPRRDSSQEVSPSQFVLAKVPRTPATINIPESTEQVSQYIPRSSPKREHISTEVKKDHLFIKGIKLEKNLFKGRWEISEINTNKGSFAVGSEQNNRLSQQVMQKMTLYLKSLFESDLEEFLSSEESE